jgi:hypothetical protein
MSNLSKYITLLEKLTNKKVRLVKDESNNILIPRRSPEEREKNYLIAINKQIQEYIKNGSKGDLDLSNSPIEILPDNLIAVGGDLDLSECKSLISLNNLKHVNGSLDLTGCKNLKGLNNLRYVDGGLGLSNTFIEILPDDLEVRNIVFLRNTPLSKNKKLLDQYKKKFKIIV